MIEAQLSLAPTRNASNRTLLLREITAVEELECRTTEALLRSIVVSGGTATLADLTLSEHDLATLAIYRHLYGDIIECHVPCSICSVPYDTQFSISDWLSSLQQGFDVVRTGANTFECEGTIRFRLPTPADMKELHFGDNAGGEQELRRRCVLDGDVNDSRLEAMMSCAGPLLYDDIEATCPHCSNPCSFTIHLETYLFSLFAMERPFVVNEIHDIASAYHWSRSEIVGLPRSERREHVRLIMADREQNRASAWH